jgi:hypothetical protein
MAMNMGKTTRGIYRDCMRLVEHVAARTVKADKIKYMVRASFRTNMGEKDPDKVEQLRANAVQALSTYLTHHGITRLKREEREETAATNDAVHEAQVETRAQRTFNEIAGPKLAARRQAVSTTPINYDDK